jgi:hypothetical protein
MEKVSLMEMKTKRQTMSMMAMDKFSLVMEKKLVVKLVVISSKELQLLPKIWVLYSAELRV